MRYQTELYVKKRKNNKLAAFFLIVLLLWSSIIAVDYFKSIYRSEKPIFVVESKETSDNPDIGDYYGLGYKVVMTDEQIDFLLFGLSLTQEDQ